jgi:hypothetical protein
MSKMLIDRALLEKALAALDAGLKLSPQSEFHDRLRAALEQEEQEPVAWECKAGGLKPLSQRLYELQPDGIKRHYTRIFRREWVSLTEEQVKEVVHNTVEKVTVSESILFRAVARAIEAALKERNHG